MKKAVVALATIGAVVGLLPVARHGTRKMRERSGQMAAHCREMCRQMAGEVGGRGQAVAP